MDSKQRILTEAQGLFFQYGIKRITMDDIAKHLGISKKTIYLHFRDKDELVHVLINEMLNTQTCSIDDNSLQAEDAVKEILLIVTFLQELLTKINPILFYDLQKYHPETWQLFRSHRNDYMKACVIKNLQRGIDEGYFRKELNLEILSIMRLEQVDSVFNQVSFGMGKFNLTEVLTEVTEHFLYGVCNLEGYRLVQKYKQAEHGAQAQLT